LLSRAIAAVDEPLRAQDLDGRAVPRVAIRLTAVAAAGSKGAGEKDVGNEAEPIQIVEDAGLVLGAASRAIVIFHAQEHAAIPFAREPPDEIGVRDVTKMQRAGGRRREAGKHKLNVQRRADGAGVLGC